MRWFFLLAALLSLAVGALHAIMGGIDALNPVMAAKTPMEARVVILVIWHAVSGFFVLSAAAYLWAFSAGSARARPLGVFLGLFNLLFAALFAGLSFLWFEDPMVLPQWTLIAPLGLFSLLGSS